MNRPAKYNCQYFSGNLLASEGCPESKYVTGYDAASPCGDVPGIGIPGIGHHPKDHSGGNPGGSGGMAPTLKGPLSPRSHMATFRVQSDQAMIRCIQDDTANHHKFFTKPPLRRLLIAIMSTTIYVFLLYLENQGKHD